MAGRFAREQGRPRLVIPWSLDAPDTRGTQAELDRGAGGYFRPSQLVRLLEGRTFDNPAYWEGAAQVLEALAVAEAEERRRKRRGGRVSSDVAGPLGPNGPFEPEHTRSPDVVLSAVRGGAVTVDAVAERTQLAPEVVQHRVLLLTLEGCLYRDAAGLLRAPRQPGSPGR